MDSVKGHSGNGDVPLDLNLRTTSVNNTYIGSCLKVVTRANRFTLVVCLHKLQFNLHMQFV